MSEKEKAFLQKISQLPEELQDKMAAQIDGAVMALDMLEQSKKKEEES